MVGVVVLAFFCNSYLRNHDSLTNPDYFQRPVPLFQPGDADMITARPKR
jgi:hypothetical protein